MYKTSGLCIFCAVFSKLFRELHELFGRPFFLHVKNILRAPFLPRAPPFYTAHGTSSLNLIPAKSVNYEIRK